MEKKKLFKRRKILKIPTKAQTANQLLALFLFSTPLCKTRYQKIVDFAERCRFYRQKSQEFRIKNTVPSYFALLHKKSAAFLVNIRAPLSEI
ncbi:MAG: hypothetical protein Q4F81_07530 [Eubacteriales bacterium]|nr:hypothetical protein [Eubacteriales bacterium]